MSSATAPVGFEHRLQHALSWESKVVAKLERCGWLATPFGQGQLPEPQRALLRRLPTALRWMPDILATRAGPAGPFCVLIDAKGGDRHKSTGNHGIETASLNALLEWKRLAKVPCVIVTPDWLVHDVEYIAANSWKGPRYGNGSGTPYRLWRGDTGTAFDACFNDDAMLALMACEREWV
jgi:hypothetical protein